MFHPVPWFSGRTARPSTTMAKVSIQPSSQTNPLQNYMAREEAGEKGEGEVACQYPRPLTVQTGRQPRPRAPVPWMHRWPSCWESHGAGTP